jgi:hypothetical protein
LHARGVDGPRGIFLLCLPGKKEKDYHGVEEDEAALIAWQDVLEMVVNGRPNDLGCPFCNHRPLVIEEVEQTTRISCSKCKKFIQGRFA